MSKNNKGKKPAQNTATAKTVNPTPKMTKEEKEAAKKAQAEKLNAEKAARKEANIKANDEAHEKNVEKVKAKIAQDKMAEAETADEPKTKDEKIKVARRKSEGYIHFLRRKRRAQKRIKKAEALMRKASEPKTYDLMIMYDQTSAEMVMNTIKEKKYEYKIMTDGYTYMKDLSATEVDDIKATLSPLKTKKGYVRFQPYKSDFVKAFLYKAPKEPKKPSNNTVEARNAARAARKIANRAKADSWKGGRVSEYRNALKKAGKAGRKTRHGKRIEGHNPGSSAGLTSLQKHVISRAKRAGKTILKAMYGKPKETTSTGCTEANMKPKQQKLPLSA